MRMRSPIAGDMGKQDRLVRVERGGCILAVATIFRDLESLEVELAIEAPWWARAATPSSLNKGS